MKKILILLFSLLLIGSSFYLFFIYQRPTSWKKYYQEKIKQPPRSLLVNALDQLKPNPGTALDLGAGVGNETLYLLKKGWKVYAVDSEKSSIELIEQRTKEQFENKIALLNQKFQDIDWSQLPQFDLIIASYSLPFVSKDHFDQVWQNIIHHLKPGGIFIVTLFEKGHIGIAQKIRKSMTFLTEKEVNDLLLPFSLHYFDLHDHVFEIVAIKN